MRGRQIFRCLFWSIPVVIISIELTAASIAACTNITLQAADRSVVRGRTMEFGIDLETQLLYIPRGTAFTGYGPNAEPNGLQWTAVYAAAGANAFHQDIIVDGLNERGLGGGILLFPSFAEFQSATEAQLAQTLSAAQLLTWALTQFATVDEVKSALPSVRVINPAIPPYPAQAFHYIFTDTSRASIVVEYMGGELQIYDNPLGVLTNSPDFPWHVTNLRNYINLSVTDVPAVTIDRMTFTPLGRGESLHGLPGDFTPPSRFIRAAFFAQAAPQLATGEQTVMQAFHIMDQFDIPPGVVPEPKNDSSAAYEKTLWTAVVDLTHRRFYITTVDNRDIRMLDMSELDPDATGVQSFPLDQPQSMTKIGR